MCYPLPEPCKDGAVGGGAAQDTVLATNASAAMVSWVQSLGCLLGSCVENCPAIVLHGDIAKMCFSPSLYGLIVGMLLWSCSGSQIFLMEPFFLFNSFRSAPGLHLH